MDATGIKVETRAVLAGAYRDGSLKSLLTHAVEVDAEGWAVRVLCSRVQLDNIADCTEEGEPSCPVCAKRAAKRAS